MKGRTLALVGMLAVAVLALASASIVQGAAGDLAASRHNFNGWKGISIDGGQLCKPCHTPHHTIMSSSLLWNRAENTTGYTLYKSTYTGLDATSKKCLSCHDGVVAVDSYGGQEGSHYVTGDAVVAGGASADLRKDHPVGVKYPALSDDGATFDSSSHYAKRYNNPTAPGFPLRLMSLSTGKGVGCSTCHSAHGSSNGYMLKVNNDASALCLTCHIK